MKRHDVIRFGFTDGSIGDATILLSVANQCNFVLETEGYHSRYELFKNNCRVEIKANPMTEVESKAIYGVSNPDIKPEDMHASIRLCKIFGVGDDYIPRINLTPQEIDWAKCFLARFKNPLVFAPVPHGLKATPQDPQRRIKSNFDVLMGVSQTLSQKYDLLYASKTSDFIDFGGTYHAFPTDFGVRQWAAILRVCGLCVSVDTGIAHLTIASGATLHCLVPHYGFGPHYHFPHYCYTKELWTKESCRAWYYEYPNWREMVDKLMA